MVKGSGYFAQFNPDNSPPNQIALFNSGLGANSAGLSPAPASKGCAVDSKGMVYYLKANPRNSVSFRAITGTGISSAFTLPGTWGAAPLGGKLMRISPGGALYIAATATASSVQAIYKMLPVSNAGTATCISTYNVNTGTTGNISTLVSMTLLPTGRMAVLTSGGTIQLYAPLPSPSNPMVSTSSSGVQLSWTSNITDSDFSGATVRRGTSGYPSGPTDGTLVTSNTSATTVLDGDVESNTTYYYTIFNRTVDGYYDDGVTISASTEMSDTTPPSTPELSAEKGSLNGNSIQLNWTVPTDTATFVLSRNNLIVSHTISASQNSYTDSGLSDGSYAYSLVAVDAFGNTSNVATSATLDIDTTPPDARIVTLTKLAPNSATVNIEWTVPTGAVAFNYRDAVGGISNGVDRLESHAYLNAPLSEGVHVISVVAIDSVGNVSSTGSAVVTVDITPPAAPTYFSATTNESTVVLNWTNPTDAALIILKQMRSITPASSDIVITQNVIESTHLISDLDDGTYYFSVAATDEFGNLGQIATVQTVVDTSPTLAKFQEDAFVKKGSLTITRNVTSTLYDPEIGQFGNTASLNINAEFNSVRIKLGVGSGSTGIVVIGSPNSSWVDTGHVRVGAGGLGHIIQSAGEARLGTILLGTESGSIGTYTLSNGILNADRLELGANGSGQFNWTGGVVSIPAIVGNVTNNGGVLQGSSLQPVMITGSYAQSASATLQLQLNSPLRSLSHARSGVARPMDVPTSAILTASDVIVVSGNLTVLMDDLNVLPGDIILLFSPPPTGNFATVSLPDLDSQLKWNTASLYTQGTIQVEATSTSVLSGRPLNYPNPFKQSTGTTIGYYLNEAVDTELRIYTSSGTDLFRKSFIKNIDEGAKLGYNRIVLNRAILGKEWSVGVYPYLIISHKSRIGSGRLVVVPE